MATTVTLDTKDPQIKALVDGWEDSREYTVTMTLRTGAGAKRNVCEVLDVEEEGGGEDQNPAEEGAEGESSSPGATAVKNAMASGKGGY